MLFQYPTRLASFCGAFILFAFSALPALAADGPDTGDTAWILTATALVLFMTLPGLALFYAGLVQAKNIVSVLMHHFAIACLMSILWVVAAYSLAFSGDGAWFGNLDKMFMAGVGIDSLSGSIPETLFAAFQMTFAVITPALVIGAYVERMKFSAVLIFSALWLLFVYAPVTHWVWGGGMLADGGLFGDTGVKDFAGGIVVHETAGLAALVIAAMLGPRLNKNTPPHNPGYVMIGAAMLWVGWFGFNGGSQLAADGGAAMALTVTHISAATASLTWALWEKFKYGKASLVGMVTGTIAGLASITPASGFVDPVQALIIGAIAGVLCQEACNVIRGKLKIDDTLDVFAVHGIGGIFGTIMIAAFGLGNWTAQLGSLVIVGIFTVVVTVVLVKLVSLLTPLRVDAEDETNGLDLTSHGERAYDIQS